MAALSRRPLLGSGALLLLAPCRGMADALQDGRFREELAALLRTRYPTARITLGADLKRLEIGGSVINLDNLYARVGHLSGAQREREIAAFLDGVMPGGPFGQRPNPAAPAGFAQVRARLRLQIVHKAYREQEPSLVARAFSRDLLIAYALDEENRYQLVTESQLRDWGIAPEALEEPARANSETDARSVTIEVSPTEPVGRFATVATPDGYAAARLLLPDFMTRLRSLLGASRIVVAIPVRDVVIAWTPDSAARRRLALVVRTLFGQGPYSRSVDLFENDAQGTRPLPATALRDHGL